jgi:hypothetical protein
VVLHRRQLDSQKQYLGDKTMTARYDLASGKIEPLIDDAIRDCYAAINDDGAFVRAFTSFNNLILDLFRHAEPPKMDDPQLTFRMMEGVILRLKGHPVPELTEKERAPQPPLRIGSLDRVIKVLLSGERRQIRRSLDRLIKTTRHAPPIIDG